MRPRLLIVGGWLLWLSGFSLSSLAHPYSVAERDAQAQQTIEALNLKTDASVLLIEPLDGRYLRVLSKSLNSHGRILLHMSHPSVALSRHLEPLLKSVAGGPTIRIENRAPLLTFSQYVDVIILDRVLHRWINHAEADKQLARLAKRLNSSGRILVVDYRQDPQRADDPLAAFGYISESAAIELLRRANLTLLDAFEFNGNPKDFRDYDQGAFTLPPTLRLGNKERERYLNIGEADRFTLLFGSNQAKVSP